MNKYYTGIGSRKTPEDICKQMTAIAGILEIEDYILRSGHADGADMAFENGVISEDYKEIYLPWKGFNGSTSKLYTQSDKAMESVYDYHPYASKLSKPVKKLMARNFHQVLGVDNNTPSDFIIYWTPSIADMGGTGQAIRIATDLGIPTYNLLTYSMDQVLDIILGD